MAFQGFEADRGTLKCRCPAAAYGLDCSFGFECHFVRGGAKMTTRLGLAVAVMMALALGAVLAGRPERMRSLVDPGLPLAA